MRLRPASSRYLPLCGVAMLVIAGAPYARAQATTVSGPVQTLDGAQALNPTLPNKLTNPFSGTQVVGGPSLNDANLSVSGRSNSSWVPAVAPFDASRPNLPGINGARTLPLSGSESFGWRIAPTTIPAPAEVPIAASTYTRSPAGTWNAPEPTDGDPLNGVSDYTRMMRDACLDMPAKCAGSGALPGTIVPVWARATPIPMPSSRASAAHPKSVHRTPPPAARPKESQVPSAASKAKSRMAR